MEDRDDIAEQALDGDEGDKSESFASRAITVAYVLFINGLFAVLALVGILIVRALVLSYLAGESSLPEAVFISLLGVLLAGIGLGFFYLAYFGAPKFLAGMERKRAKNRDRPWLLKRQWRARRIVSSRKYTAYFMWFWCACWWAIIGFLWHVNEPLIRADLQGPWSVAIPALIPFIAGIIGLIVAISLTWQRIRYGDTVLTFQTLPGYLGGKFTGTVSARSAKRPVEPVSVELTCGSLTSRRVAQSNGSGFTTVWDTTVFWSDRQDIHPQQLLFSRGRVAIPIRFDLPADQPESGYILDDPQIVWEVEIKAGSVLDKSLECKFQIPVFARGDGLTLSEGSEYTQ